MVNIADDTILALSANASFQSLGEGAVILLIDSGQLYTCNETTEAFLKLVDGKLPFGTIVERLAGEFAVDRVTASSDFLAMARQLQSEGIIDVKSAA
jgi:pyrroloquinoline quinone biosynthesis protein D